MKFNKILRPLVAVIFGLATIIPNIASADSKGGYSRPSAPSSAPPPRAYTPPPQVQRTPDPPRQFTAPPAAPTQNGFTKPGAPPAQIAPPPPASTQNGFTKPGAPPARATTGTTAIPPKNGPPPNALAGAQTRNMSANSLNLYQDERERAKHPPMPISPADTRNNPAYVNASRAYGGNFDTYMTGRHANYSSFRDSNRDTFVIVHEIRPNYGIYDSGFLTGMIMGAYIHGAVSDHNADMQHAAWLNAQQNQAWYSQYMSDLRQQAETNAQLRERLAYMEGQQAQAKAQGVTVDATQLPHGVDPSIAIAPEAVITDSNFTQPPTEDQPLQ